MRELLGSGFPFYFLFYPLFFFFFSLFRFFPVASESPVSFAQAKCWLVDVLVFSIFYWGGQVGGRIRRRSVFADDIPLI